MSRRDSLLGGTDYAWGGAQTDLSGVSFMSTPNIGTQISTFLASHTLNANQLVTLWGGANDFVNNGQTDFHIPVQNLAAEITILASAGGMHFLVPNLPLLGELPTTAALPQATRDALDLLTLAYNADLKATLDQLHPRDAGVVGPRPRHQGDGRPPRPAGFVALVPDLYHGELAGHDEMDKAAQLMQACRPIAPHAT